MLEFTSSKADLSALEPMEAGGEHNDL